MSLLQKAYIQKSRIFLLPLIGIKKDRIYRPTNTYISARGLVSTDFPSGISIQDETIMVVFSKDYEKKELESIMKLKLNSPLGNWEKFETEVLMSNRNFTGFYESEEDYIYTFNLSDWSEDWSNFISGSYSKFSSDAKDKIVNFRWKNLAEEERKKLYCYLYPYKDECITSFAKELTTEPRDLEANIQMLREIGELCNKPDLRLEEYEYQVNKKLVTDENKD